MTKKEMSNSFEELDFPTYDEEFWKGVAIAQDRLVKLFTKKPINKTRYFLVEETWTYQKNSYVPTTITGYGKCDWDEFWEDQKKAEYSPFTNVTVMTFITNREYNQYIRKMQQLGARVNYYKRNYEKDSNI